MAASLPKTRDVSQPKGVAASPPKACDVLKPTGVAASTTRTCDASKPTGVAASLPVTCDVFKPTGVAGAIGCQCTVPGPSGDAKPCFQATDQEDIDLSGNPEGSGWGDRAWLLVCEAFGAGFRSTNCWEAFALGTVVSQAAAGVLDPLSLQERGLKIASFQKQNYVFHCFYHVQFLGTRETPQHVHCCHTVKNNLCVMS